MQVCLSKSNKGLEPSYYSATNWILLKMIHIFLFFGCHLYNKALVNFMPIFINRVASMCLVFHIGNWSQQTRKNRGEKDNRYFFVGNYIYNYIFLGTISGNGNCLAAVSPCYLIPPALFLDNWDYRHALQRQEDCCKFETNLASQSYISRHLMSKTKQQ